MAPAANIIALKALGADGKGTISRIIMAIDYAISVKNVQHRVINMSLGAGVYAESYNTDPLTIAAKRAFDAGIVVVAAAGNMGKAANGQPQETATISADALQVAHRRRFEHRGHRRSAEDDKIMSLAWAVDDRLRRQTRSRRTRHRCGVALGQEQPDVG